VPKIVIQTKINAPIERVFDLACSVDLHLLSTSKTNEKAIAGRTSGLIELNDSITWSAKHFCVYQTLTVKVVDLDKPNKFQDVMIKGAFKSMKHVHLFKEASGYTIMIDEFEFTSPFWILGKLAESLFLTNYMKRFLIKKNEVLIQVAEGNHWREILKPN
jgi:ligand-binding SRPBCC domain-containing protein